MDNKRALGALALDLKRVAIGYQRGSIIMAKRFSEEALINKSKVDTNTLKPYIKKLLGELENILTGTDTKKIAENSLMISTLLQNYALKSM